MRGLVLAIQTLTTGRTTRRNEWPVIFGKARSIAIVTLPIRLNYLKLKAVGQETKTAHQLLSQLSKMTRLSASLSLVLIASLAACSPSPAYDDTWGDEVLADGKNDGLADLATPIEFGQSLSGAVDEQSLRMYKVRLRSGDSIRLTKEVTSGDLSPHFTLFFGTSEKLFSDDFEVTESRLIKSYTADFSGQHIIVARAFRNQGAGEFSLTLDCTGGPCAGEFEEEDSFLSFEENSQCIQEAQECAFAEMARFNGAVGTARARSLFESCLAQIGTDDGESCKSACINNENADDFLDEFNKDICDRVISDIPFFADQSEECLQVLDDCMESCEDSADGVPHFQLCWDMGFNGTCPSYAMNTEACGGELEEGSTEDCHAFCESTTGAWIDDLDVICAETCE